MRCEFGKRTLAAFGKRKRGLGEAISEAFLSKRRGDGGLDDGSGIGESDALMRAGWHKGHECVNNHCRLDQGYKVDN